MLTLPFRSEEGKGKQLRSKTSFKANGKEVENNEVVEFQSLLKCINQKTNV